MGTKDHFDNKKSTATRAKHELLSKYIKVWIGMILNHLGHRSGCIVFLDTCAGTGSFRTDDPNFLDWAGSPLIGLETVVEVKNDPRFDHKNKKYYLMLFEKEKPLYDRLIQVLKERSYDKDLYSVENDDYRNRLDSILECMSESYNLAFLDPFNMEPLPFDIVKKIITTGKTDAILYFPAMQIQRYQGYLRGNDFPGRERMIDNVTQFFGDDSWIDIVKTITDGDKALMELTKHYMKKIAALGKHCIVMDFLYEKQKKIIYKIILITKNTEALLQSKRIFSEISSFQKALRSDKRFPLLEFNKDAELFELPVERIATSLFDAFAGKYVTGEEIYRWAAFEAGPGVFKGNVRKAVTKLTKEKRIVNTARSKWNANSTIKFLSEDPK
jgi:three-Cys-motif partner protein